MTDPTAPDAARLVVREVGDEVLVYDLESDQVHLLAAEAAQEWKDAPVGFDRRAFLRRSAAVGGMALAGAASQTLIAPPSWAVGSILPLTTTYELATEYTNYENVTATNTSSGTFSQFGALESPNGTYFSGTTYSPSTAFGAYNLSNRYFKPGGTTTVAGVPTTYTSLMSRQNSNVGTPALARVVAEAGRLRIRPKASGSQLAAVRFTMPVTRPLTSTGTVQLQPPAAAGTHGVAVYRFRGAVATALVPPTTTFPADIGFTDPTATALDTFWVVFGSSSATPPDGSIQWTLSYTA